MLQKYNFKWKCSFLSEYLKIIKRLVRLNYYYEKFVDLRRFRNQLNIKSILIISLWKN